MTAEFLSEFESEDRVSPSASLVSLHDIVGRQVAVHWDEAVAVVEELCDLAIAGAGDMAPVPAIGDVLVGADGHVTLRSHRGEKSPTAAGRMLHTLLSNSDVPMALRLFVTQSTSDDTHRSLREFAGALAYFGKPDRRRLIQDIYHRFSQAGQTVADAAAGPPSIPAREPAHDAKPQQEAKRKAIKKWLFAAAALAVASSGAWLWNRGGSDGMQGSAVRMLSGAADALAGLSQQVSKVFSQEASAPVVTTADPSIDHSPPKPKRRPTEDTIGAAPAPIPGRRVSLPKAAGALPLAAVMPSRVEFEATAVYPQPAEPPAAAVETVYSSADLDVEPPTLVFPQLTPPLVLAGRSAPAINRMMVVVSPEGTVERVQLVEGPARMVDMMLLSGAKTWRFTPALKNGEPVRYRTVISWAVQQ